MDALPVEPQELVNALRFKIKDRIDFPVTEAAIDYFQVPEDTRTQKKIYVVVTKTKLLQAMADLMSNSYLK